VYSIRKAQTKHDTFIPVVGDSVVVAGTVVVGTSVVVMTVMK
jgi:hypothetical protein